MKLSFECNLDPKSLPTKNGKKFCDSCRHHVVDLRRKSDEKIALFFRENIDPCVIIHQHQLEKLPIQSKNVSASKMRYFPYAAGIITATFLPALTIAQSGTTATVQMVGHTPIPISPANKKSDTQPHDVKKTANQKYTLNGRVSIRDKKYKMKNGKDVVIYRTVYDSAGNNMGRDTIAVAKLGVNGKFKLSLTKEEFDLIKKSEDELYVNVDVFRIERIEELTFSENKVDMIISASAKEQRVFMGRRMTTSNF